MDILDRLRPRWRRSDPDVRATAVREMDEGDQRLETIARDDPDPKIRRIAIKKLDDADAVERLAQGETDETLRTFIAERAREIRLTVACSAGSPAACEAALARLSDERSLAAVATTAAHEALRHGALARTTGDRALRDVVRSANDPAIRRAALARIEDVAILRSIAVGDGPAELALQALERIADPDALRAIADHRTAAKSVRQRARALLPAGGEHAQIGTKEARARQLELCVAVERLVGARDPVAATEQVREAQREWAEVARQIEPKDDVAHRFQKACAVTLDDVESRARRRTEADAARSALQENLAARTALCERVEHLDDAADPAALEEFVAAWHRLPPATEDDAAVARRFRLACESARERHRRWTTRDATRAQLDALVVEAEALAGAAPLPTEKAWQALEKRWTGLTTSPEGVGDLIAHYQGRLTDAREQLAMRRREADAQRGEAEKKNVARLEALCKRLQELATTESLDAKVGRRELRAAEAAVADLGPLPSSERRPAWLARVTEARDALQKRMREVEETDEWRRWANVAAQEELIRRVEALLESNDLSEGMRQLAQLQDEWAAVASAPRDKAQALWDRFRTARDELRKRVDAWLADNLAKKRALCTQVAALGESTSWNETAALIKGLQAEWKEIGPVPVRHAQALWQEFRAPCDHFFNRRKEHFARLDDQRQAAATAKAALCEQAEALADSTDWEATTTVMKRLQAEWKQSGPLPRAQSEEMWQRFKTACDRFFNRRSRRDELEQEARVQQAQTICDELDALAATLATESAPAAEQIGQTVDQAWASWLRLEVTSLASAAPLVERLHATCQQIATAQPECLRGTRLDPATTHARREKLCARLEKLLDATTEAPRELSLQEMALALRERLATNTIAGDEAGRAQGQDTAREVERISASWMLLGPPLDADAQALAERFARARERARAASK